MFRDRADAGRRLSVELLHLQGERPIVLGLPRGGVAVAFEVARALEAPLDVVLVRKLGVPFQPELAMGAIGEGGVRVLNRKVLRAAGIPAAALAEAEDRARAELDRRAARLRAGRPRVPMRDRTVIVVDDGIATGSTALAACAVVRAMGPRRLVLATPVAPRASLDLLGRIADDVACVATPAAFFAIGEWYDDFSQMTDDEVVDLLRRFPQDAPASGTPDPSEP